MKKMSRELFIKREQERAEQKKLNYKQVNETKQNDKKADVDVEVKCFTRQGHNDRKTCL